VDPVASRMGTEDYSTVISTVQEGGVETIIGVCNPPDFSNFWKQLCSRASGRKSHPAKALLLPAGIEALGDVGAGQTWRPGSIPSPFKSDVTV